jgi:hypothetical protein
MLKKIIKVWHTVKGHDKFIESSTLEEYEKELNPNYFHGLGDYSFIQSRMSKLLGMVLTVIDASISDKVQNKAIKDLIKTDFVEEYAFLSESLIDDQYIQDAQEDVALEDLGEVDALAVVEEDAKR